MNTGEAAGVVPLERDRRASFRDGTCTITFALGVDALEVEDNNGCGGVNVTFTGAYWFWA